MKDGIYDVMVLGGGPGGYSAAITAAQQDKEVIIFEGENLGGVCLNVGCIPTKYLLDKAGIMEKIRKLTDQRIFKDTGVFSFKKIQQGKQEVINKMVGGVEYLLKANGIEVVRDFATLKDCNTVICKGREYTGSNIIIATGSEPAAIPIPGKEYALDSTGALNLEKIPKRMVVIGGGVIGMELASAYCSFGTEVTVLEAVETLFPLEEPAAIKQLESMLIKSGISIHTNTRVNEIQKKNNGYVVTYVKNNIIYEVNTDQVLMATGRKARLPGIDVEKLGIEINSKGEIITDDNMKTSIENVYAIGDVRGGYQLAHAAYAEAEIAIKNICGEKEISSLKAIPRCIYTIPAFAAVGKTSVEATLEGIDCVVGSFSYSANGMAMAEGASGSVSVIMDKKLKTTIGVHIVGENSPELISLATLAVENDMTLKEWRELVIAHPSLSEMLKEAALDCFGLSIHRSVRKTTKK